MAIKELGNKYKKRIKLVANQSYHLMEHHFFNLDKDEIMLWSDSTVKEETPQKNPKAKSRK